MNKFDIKSWTLWRATRMILGLVFGLLGLFRGDWVLSAAGIFLIVHAWINHCAACANVNSNLPREGKS